MIALVPMWRDGIAGAVAATAGSITPSASGTTIPTATQIIDSSGNIWTVSDAMVYENGALANYTANVAWLIYEKGIIYHQNTAGEWYSWNGIGWVSTGASTTATAATTATTVGLGSVDNVNALADPGTDPVNGGADTANYAFAANLLGTSTTYAGSTFTFDSAAGSSAVTSTTITLPTGKFSSLQMLATAVFGPVLSQTFTVTYTDGTSSTFTQSMSDWGLPQSYPGESNAVSTAYRITPTGVTQSGPWDIYGYTFALDSAKTVLSFTLPDTTKVLVFAIDLDSSTATGTAAGTADATLTWTTPTLNTDGTALTDLAGYTIYYGSSPSALTKSVQLADPSATSYVISNLNASTYYFSIAAYASTGIQSTQSAVISMAIGN